MFEFDLLSLLCNMNTLRKILMMLSTNIEQAEMVCCMQEWQFYRDWFGEGGGGWQFYRDWFGEGFFFSKKPFLVAVEVSN